MKNNIKYSVCFNTTDFACTVNAVVKLPDEFVSYVVVANMNLLTNSSQIITPSISVILLSWHIVIVTSKFNQYQHSVCHNFCDGYIN